MGGAASVFRRAARALDECPSTKQRSISLLEDDNGPAAVLRYGSDERGRYGLRVLLRSRAADGQVLYRAAPVEETPVPIMVAVSDAVADLLRQVRGDVERMTTDHVRQLPGTFRAYRAFIKWWRGLD